jgi:hypothetical protein
MKKFAVLMALMALLSVMVLAIPVAAAGPGYEVLDTADLSNADVTAGGRCTSFNPEAPGGWGGEFGQGAVTAFPGDLDSAGYVSLYTFFGAGKAVRIRHLDGIADDSFDLFVKDVRGAWIKVGHYTDKGSTEQWMTTEFDLTRDINGKRVNLAEGRTIEIKIMPTAPAWSGFGTWGQLAIDKVELLGQGRWQPP